MKQYKPYEPRVKVETKNIKYLDLKQNFKTKLLLLRYFTDYSISH